MRETSTQSREVIDIIGDVVGRAATDCILSVPDNKGGFKEVECPKINFVFGNAQYVKDLLDELSKTTKGNELKFPMIVLFFPFEEQRDNPGYYSKTNVRLWIAHSSRQQWSNEQRLEYSFRRVLRPIYKRLCEELRQDRRLDFGYDDVIRHKYSENYSIGRYGAITPAGEEVSEPIDAIYINNLELKVKLPNCRF